MPSPGEHAQPFMPSRLDQSVVAIYGVPARSDSDLKPSMLLHPQWPYPSARARDALPYRITQPARIEIAAKPDVR